MFLWYGLWTIGGKPYFRSGPFYVYKRRVSWELNLYTYLYWVEKESNKEKCASFNGQQKLESFKKKCPLTRNEFQSKIRKRYALQQSR